MDDTERKSYEAELAELRSQIADLRETTAVLASSVNSLTKSVEGLVEAWGTAKGITAFVKWLSGMIVSCGVVWALIKGVPHG